MDSQAKIKEVREKISELQILVEDFVNMHYSKKNKISNLESEIEDLKLNMNGYLDDLEDLIDKK